jgi:TolB-like protein/class 3 adenylate cyclase
MAERRLAAIMAAGIVGYSRLIEADEAATLAKIGVFHSEVIDPLLAEHKGRVVKLMDGGALVEFGSVVDAVACAVAVQKEVGARQSDVPPERRIVFRIGINLGDVVVEGNDLLGDGVNVAMRLEQLCPPGGVLISGTAYDHMKGKLSLPRDHTGEQQVKNISQPVRAYAVRMDGVKRGGWHARRFRRWLLMAAALLPVLLIAGAGISWFQLVDTATAQPSVAVLPFDNLGGDDATTRLADGITQDIITDLATFPEFDVVARNSTELYRGEQVDVRQVSQDLGVGYVLEGSIQRRREQIRITAQLIDGDSGKHVWSERWDRPTRDIFAVQAEIAEQVTDRLAGGAGLIGTAGRQAPQRKRPDNLAAYEVYLLGAEKLEPMKPADNEEAIRLLSRAVELDPGLARAWVELSHAHSLSSRVGTDPAAARKAAMAAADRAVMLDPRDAEAHAALGVRLCEIGDLARAEAEFETALSLSPGSAEILTLYAGWASSFGEPERGAEIVDRVIRLNPSYPMREAGLLSYAYFMAGRYQDAASLLKRVPPKEYMMNTWVRAGSDTPPLGRPRQVQPMPRSYAALARPEPVEPVQAIVQQAQSARVWYEYGVATAIGGYDSETSRTLINRFYIVAFGPVDLPREVTSSAQACLHKVTVVAVEAFNNVPSPEVGARLAAAYSAFHGSLEACLAPERLAKAYSGKFEIGYVRRAFWEPGLRLKFHAESPSTKNYARLHNAVKDRLLDPLNKIIVFYINAQKIPDLDFRINPPADLGKFLKTLPDPSELRTLVSNAQTEAAKRGKRIAEEVGEEANEATKRLGSEAAKIGQEVPLVPVLVDGEAATGVKAVVPDLSPIPFKRDEARLPE